VLFNGPITKLHKVNLTILSEITLIPPLLGIPHINFPHHHLPLSLQKLLISNLVVVACLNLLKHDLILVILADVLQQVAVFGPGDELIVSL